jgi:hypothetical protein
MRRATIAVSVLCIVLMLVAPTEPVAEAAARQGNQGLQGGWSVDDGGRVNFLHSASQQFSIMRDAGAGWVRVHFRLGACFATWSPQAPACGTADGATALAVYDLVVENALANNLKVVGLFSQESWRGTQADWTANNAENNPTNDPSRTGDNAYVRAFAEQAVRPIVARYQGKVAQWEVWNEPNAYESLDGAGNPVGGTFLYPSNFAWLLKRAHVEVRAAGGAVISGGLLGHDQDVHTAVIVENGRPRRAALRGTLKDTRLERGRRTPVRPGVVAEPAAAAAASCETVPTGADYLCSTYDAGIATAGWAAYKAQAGSYPLDQVGQHVYIDQGAATTSRELETYLAEVRNAYLRSEGSATAKKTYVTEFGWETTGSLTPQLQAQNLQVAFTTFKGTRYVGRAFWFNVQDIAEGDLWWGLVRSDYDARSPNPALRKPSFAAFQKYATY